MGYLHFLILQSHGKYVTEPFTYNMSISLRR